MIKKKTAILLIFLLASLTVALGACSSNNYDEAEMYVPDSDKLMSHHYLDEFDADIEEELLYVEMVSDEPLALTRSVANTILADRVIHRASIGIVVDDFDRGVEQVAEFTAVLDGFIEASYITGETSFSLGREGDFTVRIPAASYNEMLEMLTEVGTLSYLNTTAVNVANQYADITSRLNSLRTQEERVLELIEIAEDLSDLLLLEERLGDIIYEIELLTGERNHLDNQISYSTINVRISEYVDAFSGDDLDPQSLGEVFITSLRAMRMYGGIALRIFVALIPWLILISAVGLVIRGVIRRRKMRKKTEMVKEENPEV